MLWVIVLMRGTCLDLIWLTVLFLISAQSLLNAHPTKNSRFYIWLDACSFSPFDLEFYGRSHWNSLDEFAFICKSSLLIKCIQNRMIYDVEWSAIMKCDFPHPKIVKKRKWICQDYFNLTDCRIQDRMDRWVPMCLVMA